MADQRDIVIAGAGIGGLTAALALAARGFRIIVCERAERLSEIGAGIQIPPNAGNILASLGLNEAIESAATEPTKIDICFGPSGRRIASIPTSALRERYGLPGRLIARVDFQRILARAAEENSNIEVRLGVTVVDTAAGSDDFLVRTETRAGRNIQPAAALIAADGVSSGLRRLVTGDGLARLTKPGAPCAPEPWHWAQ